MGKNPAFQFYPGDWQQDLSEHPLEIEGAWIRIICALWNSKTCGQSSKSLTNWARVLRVGEKKSLTIIKYLMTAGIADIKSENGLWTISSRRMIRDEKIREIRKMAGSLGGNPALKKHPILVKQKVNPDDNQGSNQNPTPSSSSSSLNNIKGNINASAPVDNSSQNDNDALLEAYSKKLFSLQNKILSKYGHAFNFTKMIRNNMGANKDAIVHCLERLLQYDAGAPEVYFQEILNRESGNFNERAFQSKVAQDKNIFSEILDKLKNLQRT